MIDLVIANKIFELVKNISGFPSLRDVYNAHNERKAMKLLEYLGLQPGQERDFFSHGGVLKAESVRKIIDTSNWIQWKQGEHCVDQILLFERYQPKKVVWFVFTDKHLICVREIDGCSRSLLRWKESISDLRKSRVNVKVEQDSKVVQIQGPNQTHRWRYSTRLHGDPRKLERQIWNLIQGAANPDRR